MPRDIKIYLIDDDPLVLQFLTAALNEMSYPIQTFSTGEAFLAHQSGEECGCLITDQYLPGIQGTEIQAILKQRGSNLSLIMITGAADVPTTIQMMKQGAITILQKPFKVDQLLTAVHEGIAQSQTLQAIQDQFKVVRARLASLTEDELNVLKCLAKGMSHKVISSTLDLSTRSVDRHRKRVLEKMHATTLQELAAILAKSELDDELLNM